MKRSITCLLLLLPLFWSCEEQQFQTEKDRETILNYIEENNLDAIEHPSGLYYVILEEGSSEQTPSPNATVEIRYKGYFLDGNVFEESRGDNTVELSLNSVITGWRIGIPLMTKGSTATLIIPSNLAYGFYGSGPIPPNTVILFDIELINFSG